MSKRNIQLTQTCEKMHSVQDSFLLSAQLFHNISALRPSSESETCYCPHQLAAVFHGVVLKDCVIDGSLLLVFCWENTGDLQMCKRKKKQLHNVKSVAGICKYPPKKSAAMGFCSLPFHDRERGLSQFLNFIHNYNFSPEG